MAARPSDPAPFDLTRFRTKPLEGREHRVETDRFARVVGLDATVSAVLGGFPDFLATRALRGLAGAIARAARGGHGVLWGMGGHVVKVGLAPVLLDLLERGLATGFVMNGAAAIHDAEIALVGTTSEDVAAGIFEGGYGNADDTGALFAEASARAARDGVGLGTALGDVLLARRPRNAELSLLCRARRAGVPVTVHVAVGTDTVHMHPACRGADVGAATHVDFRRLATLVDGLDGGVYVNVGSAVLLPEVFMKAVTVVHNATPGRRVRITTGNLDFLQHYRPRVNVVQRPAVEGFELTGPHELLVPLLRLAVLDALARGDAAAGGPA